MLLGDFQLGDRIASGGISEIYRAHHSVLGKPAAIKLLSEKYARSPEHQSVLMAEARAHARLRHPQIVELYDCGDTDEPLPRHFLALELADGNLAERLPISGIAEFVEVMTSVLRSLMYAHARGVLHRDIKPENILVFESDTTRYKLSDFGVALGTREADHRHGLHGTPLYMAPEQVTGQWRLCGPWTDVYAAGVVAWELLTGKPPHTAEGLAEISQIKNDRDPGQFEPLFDVPHAVERWTRRMLSRSIHARYAMAADALRGLDEVLKDTNVNRQSGEFQKVDRSKIAAAQTLLDAPPILVDSSPDILVPQVLVYDPPGLPEDWTAVDARTQGQSIGLGLFALRPLPFVGHEPARDQLWRMLSRVAQGEGLRCVWVESEIESEAGELAEWFSDEVSESGAARVFRLNHTRERGPMDGFTGALVAHFSTAGLSNESIQEHLANRLGWNESGAQSDLRVLASEMCLEQEGPQSDLERHRVLARFFVRLCAERPVVILIENAQWGLDALNFVGMMQRTFSHLPILFVPVINRSAADENSLEMAAMGRLNEHMLAHRISLEPPTRADHRQRIDLMLEMTEDLASSIAEITSLDASWSSLLINELIERDQLVATSDGYGLKDSCELPQTLDELIRSRLETLPSEATIQALEIAAVLGLAPSRVELDAALSAAGIRLEPEEVQRFSDAGLIQLEDSWRFTHYEILEVLRERSREEGRWVEQNTICATVMDQKPRSSNVAYNYTMRLGWHALQAQRPELALDELAHLVMHSCRGMPELGSRCLDLREQLVLMLTDGAEGELEMVRQSLMRAVVLLRLGQPEKARGVGLDALRLARLNNYVLELALALRFMGSEAIDRGDAETGIRFLEEGRRIARDCEDWDTLGQLEVSLGWAQFCQSNFEESLAHYDSARECLEKSSGLLPAEPDTFIAITYIAMDELQLARRHTDRALEVIRESRDLSLLPEVVNNLAEIARFEGRWEDAHRYVESTAWWRSLTGHRFTHIDDFNRGLVAIGAGRFGDARQFLDGLNERYVDAGLHSRLGLIYAAQAAMELGWGNDREAGRRLELLRSFLALKNLAHRDIAWACERGFELAVDVENADLARQFGAFAVAQYVRIGLSHRASAIERRMEKPEDREQEGVTR